MKSFDDFVNDKKSLTENINESVKDDEYYYNIKDPKTGERYDIPMLKFLDHKYKEKYIDYMKMLEKDPTSFERLLKWN